jgi:hypothetical protein
LSEILDNLIEELSDVPIINRTLRKPLDSKKEKCIPNILAWLSEAFQYQYILIFDGKPIENIGGDLDHLFH